MRILAFSPLALSLLASAAAAQETRARFEVTPEGVFVRHDLSGSAVTPLVNPNPSPRGLRWTYPNPAGVPWITQSVSVGLSGTLAWLGQNLNGQRLSLVATTDTTSPPTPIWQVLFPGATRIDVRAADKGATCAVAVSTSTSWQLHYFSAFSSTPLFTVTLASGFKTAISDNGRYITAGYSPTTMSSQVDVFDALSGTPTTPIATLTATSHGFRNHDISGDGKTVLIASNTRNHVFDVATQTEIGSGPTVSHDAHSINFDGTVWARGGFDVGAWVKVGTAYNRVLTYNDTGLGFPVYTAADVSGDGTTFVTAAYDANNNARFRVYCFRITPTSGTLLWTYINDGTGTLQDTPQAVSVSDNGKWIAVASWGAQAAGHPEVLFFDRDAGNVPVGSIDTPGSAFDVDLSGDGQFAAAGTKAVHANTFGNGGEGYSFDRGGQGHRLKGTPSISRTINLETGGNSGDVVLLALGRATGAPIPIPGFLGTFDLNPTLLITTLLAGVVPGAGVLPFNLTVPNDPSLVANTVFSQAIRFGIANEFDNFVPIVITP